MAYINFERADFEDAIFGKNSFPCRIYINYKSENHDYLSNWHSEPEFIYTISGSQTIYVENDCYVTQPGDIVVVNSGRIHTISGKEWAHHCVIPSELVYRTLGISHDGIVLQPHIRDKQLSDALLTVVNEHVVNRKYAQQYKTLAVQQFLLQAFERFECNHLSESPQKKNPHFVVTVKVIDFLRQHMAEDFSIETIAKEFGITSSYMCRCVKAATGISIIDHLNRLRCYTAKHYLMHSNKKVNEIAAICGYQSNSYFAKTYQKIIGCSPNETPRSSAPKKDNSKP